MYTYIYVRVYKNIVVFIYLMLIIPFQNFIKIFSNEHGFQH